MPSVRLRVGGFLLPEEKSIHIKLSPPFAADGAVDPFDVRQMKKALNRLGYYQPYEKVGVTGFPDSAVFAALKKFQKDHNLPATGSAKPDDETVQAINDEAAKTPQGEYIWRTVDDEKVRSSHKVLNGKVRKWSDSPDPGEEFNCRCWAENVTNSCEKEEIMWVNAGAKLFIAMQNFERAENEKNQLEDQKSEKESKIAEIDARLKEEKKDRRDAQNKGAPIGAIIGAPMGPGSSMGMSSVGLGLGAGGGRFIEEIGDAVSNKSQTDISLAIRKQRLLKEFKNIKIKLEKVTSKIDDVLAPEFQKAQQQEEKAKTELRACKLRNKE